MNKKPILNLTELIKLMQDLGYAQCHYNSIRGGFGEPFEIIERDKNEKISIELNYYQIETLRDGLNLYYKEFEEEYGNQEYKPYGDKSEEEIKKELAELIKKLCGKAKECEVEE